MNGRGLRRVEILGSLSLSLALAVAGGCGEKIAIPEPVGDFGTNQYYNLEEYSVPDARAAVVHRGYVFVLTGSELQFRSENFDSLWSLSGQFQDARAFCVFDTPFLGYETVFFVYEAAGKQVLAIGFDSAGDPALAEVAAWPVPEAVDATHIHAMQHEPEGLYVYLADPGAGVIRRYLVGDGLQPRGILARADGEGARFVHVAQGMATDLQGYLLVCDADTARNWVLRFDPTPDQQDGEEMRGTALIFPDETDCFPEPAPADYVLGNAAECDSTNWVGGPGSALGWMHSPAAVVVDGAGDIYVADTFNNRMQKFGREGEVLFAFGAGDGLDHPLSITLEDIVNQATAQWMRGAKVYVVTADGKVILYVSGAYYLSQYQNRDDPRP